MSALIFDTETTGLPTYGAANPADAEWQPRMCSIAMALVDDEGAVVRRYGSLVKPVGWPLDNEKFMENYRGAEAIHHIPLERLQAEGRPIEDIADVWDSLYSGATYVAGYPIMFDHKVMRGELKRLGRPIPFRDKQFICLMKMAAAACKERGIKVWGGKLKLKTAVETLLGAEQHDPHTARGDLDDTIELYQWGVRERRITPEDQPMAKKKPE